MILQFTDELEVNIFLPVLDSLASWNAKCFEFEAYRKPTYSDRSNIRVFS
ncbi:hypothetical protein QYM36_002708 [Artemia franciscana]|uniref:Uncharacterized protein n=1 Tax=Artemia franciscana TaxID=6661 RepID=A0AA88I6N6_ARTSF|nr:hypothetical protein QYM36_002708 [Artemia franciscana]KAK2722268.1 hypothetical protein QYM36_002708 [Artemia franciscana]